VCPPDEALGFKLWITGVAGASAKASSEGRVLGIGGDRVSTDEHESLDAIGAARRI